MQYLNVEYGCNEFKLADWVGLQDLIRWIIISGSAPNSISFSRSRGYKLKEELSKAKYISPNRIKSVTAMMERNGMFIKIKTGRKRYEIWLSLEKWNIEKINGIMFIATVVQHIHSKIGVSWKLWSTHCCYKHIKSTDCCSSVCKDITTRVGAYCYLTFRNIGLQIRG